MSNNIHDMRQAYERQLAAKDARIAALEAALVSTANRLVGIRDELTAEQWAAIPKGYYYQYQGIILAIDDALGIEVE